MLVAIVEHRCNCSAEVKRELGRKPLLTQTSKREKEE